jgi:7-carboxy-7-deazaguanine synthase
MEIFGPTIQGEGGMIGVKTMFIRFGGCDYRCKMCDSMFAVDPKSVHEHARWLTAQEIAEEVAELAFPSNTGWITLSGGNPAMWQLGELVSILQRDGFKVAIETQGTIYNDWIRGCNHITVSPKSPGMGERYDDEQFWDFMQKIPWDFDNVVANVKIVVFSMQDLDFVVGVDRLLDRIKFPGDQRYISLGNPYPPGPLGDRIDSDRLPAILLADYKAMLEMDFLTDKRLWQWKFLPQLHVLLWNNKQGV